LVWNAPKLQQCYKQNTMIYANDEALAAHPKLAEAHAKTHSDQLNVVHPLYWKRMKNRMRDMRLELASLKTQD